MKNGQIYIFLLVVFIIYFIVNAYIFSKGFLVFRGGRYSAIYSVSFIFLASLFIAGKLLERNHSGIFSDILNVAGGFWLAYMLYAFLLYLISDIAVSGFRLTGVLTADSLSEAREWKFVAVNIFTLLIIIAGFINALTPVIVEYPVQIAKRMNGALRIMVVSDIHMGSIIRKRSLRRLNQIAGDLRPDMVLLVGDIVDGEIGPVLRGDLLASFRCPPCSEGVYAVTGNHEYIGGIDKTAPYIRSKGIKLLEDEVLVTPSGLILAGRSDRDSYRYTGEPRKSLAEILNNNIPADSPFIVMDHQPLAIEESVANNADLHLSGHTHNGQIWPLSLLIRRMYKIAYGIVKTGNTSVIVSSGYGLWGPRVRTGSRPEVVLIKLSSSLED